MFVAINIDFFNIEFFIIENNNNIKSSFIIAISDFKTADQYISEICNAMDFLEINFTDCLYVSVMNEIPKFNYIIEKIFNKYIKTVPIFIKRSDIKLDVLNDQSTEDVPLVTLATAFSSLLHFNKDNIIVVNIDQVVTVSAIVDRKFCGYTTYPGIDLISSVLHQKASFFPDILPKTVNEYIAFDKYDALSFGIFNGLNGACNAIIEGIVDTFQKDFFVVASGKYSEEIAKYSKNINHVEKKLKIIGMLEIAKRHLVTV